MRSPLEVCVFIYLVIAVITVFGLKIRWIDTNGLGKPIWPIAGMGWPALVLIGLWKAWENRND